MKHIKFLGKEYYVFDKEETEILAKAIRNYEHNFDHDVDLAKIVDMELMFDWCWKMGIHESQT